MFFYLVYRLGYVIANLLTLRLAYWLAERFADIQYFLAADDRAAVAENLSVVLNKKPKECFREAHQVFRNFGLYLVDFFRMTRLDKKAIEERVDVVDIENLDNALKQNRGVIILSSHIGNWEMGGVAVAMMGYSISAVALNHKHKNINDFFIGQREKRGMKVIRMSSIMKGCLSILLNKEILALVGDRDFTNTGVMTDFFGIPTSIPKGPAVLSLKNNSPVVPVFFIREGRFRYKLVFDKPIEPHGDLEELKEQAVRDITKKFVAVMEKYIRDYPEQWLVFRRFWETPVDAFVL